jgi:hypothetical protein
VFSITYLSHRLIDPHNQAGMLDDIMIDAIARNTALGITGLLIVSPDHFAQLLEGPRLAVEAVMTSIKTDRRHTAVRIVRQSDIAMARCSNWRMVRLDQPGFGVSAISPLLKAAHFGEDPEAVNRLEQLIDSMATRRRDLLLAAQSQHASTSDTARPIRRTL